MKKIKLFLPVLLLLAQIFVTKANAQTCDHIGQCLNNRVCECVANCGTSSAAVIVPGSSECGSADLGAIARPQGVLQYDLEAGGSGNIGLLKFVSVIIKIVTVGAGLWSVGNFVFAGVKFISAFGDTKVYGEVRDRITWSVVGLVIIAAAYLLAGLIGQLFFGDPSFLLNPQLQGALTPPTP